MTWSKYEVFFSPMMDVTEKGFGAWYNDVQPIIDMDDMDDMDVFLFEAKNLL